MKRMGILLCLMLAVMMFTGCGEAVEILPEEVVDTQTVECTVIDFYETSVTTHNRNYYGYGQYGYGQTGNHYGNIYGYEQTNVNVQHYVYLKDNDGDVASFEITADCAAALNALKGKEITLEYEKRKGKLYTRRCYKWNDFELEYSSLVEAGDTVTTDEQEG